MYGQHGGETYSGTGEGGEIFVSYINSSRVEGCSWQGGRQGRLVPRTNGGDKVAGF